MVVVEGVRMARPTSECEFDPDHLYHDHREADVLRAENERLRERKCFVCTDWMKQAERANAEAQRMRDFLKYLKGEAQDRDDVKLMDEIDRVLASR